MSSSEQIRILHLTDSHVSIKNQEHVKSRIIALYQYLNASKIGIDLIVFTGDLTNSGKPEEFALFEEIVEAPLRKQLHVNKSKFVIIPGNHDVDRDRITVPENNRLRKMTTSEDVEKALESTEKSWPRLLAFSQYSQKLAPNTADYAHTEFCGGLYSTRRINHVKGVNIGLALFNSAWLCADDNDKQNLFLTEKQVRDATKSLETCDLRIALCHHPKDWFNPSESNIALNDLHRDFPLILTGHLHQPISTQEIDTTGNSISLIARALFDGKTSADVEDGFHLYELDIPKGKITVNFRKYIRKRKTFDKDTDHAEDGRFTFNLALPLSLSSNSSLLVQRLSGEAGKLDLEVRETLAHLQGVAEPVFVKPKISSFRFRKGARRTLKDELSIGELLQGNSIISGDRDAGKSIVLKTLASQAQRLSPSSFGKSAAIYLPNIPKASWEDEASLQALIEERLDEKNEVLNGFHLIVIVDGIHSNQSKCLNVLSSLCKARGWTYVASATGHEFVNILSQDPAFKDVLFAEVRPWGPSRIREFTQKLFEGTDLDPELAYRSVCTCLRAIDIPSNPAIVCLYVSAFSKVGAKLSSLSFLRFLEKIEQIKLGADESGTINSLYNRQKILMTFAVECLNQGAIYISQGRALDIIDDYFKPSKLKTDPKQFLDFIIQAGVLNATDDSVEFSNFVFWDYYLAMSFKEGLLAEADFTTSIARCARVAAALSLFAGMKRENSELAEKTLKIVEAEFLDAGKLGLKDLDQHINGLLFAENRDEKEADVVTQEALHETEDQQKIDDEYHQQRKRVAENRKELMSRDLDESFDVLSAKIEGLHAFYSILRNLENIEANRKEWMIDRILDYHISTNFDLINFYFQYSKNEDFRTHAAYMLTLGGHTFMASSLGNPSMCDSICSVLEATQSDFKKFLLLLLLSDLGDDRACSLIDSFLEIYESRAATEIFFVHVRKKLVEHQSRKLPVDLLSLFKKLFISRQTKFGGSGSVKEAKGKLGGVVSKIKVEHHQQWKDRWASEEDRNSGGEGESPIVDI